MRNEYSLQIMARCTVNELRESAARERSLKLATMREPGICCQALISLGKAMIAAGNGLKAILERNTALST
ncbi:MAG: hypothetical protein MUO76_07905 [Anaerolineaceae bacterium]|nr:hypothetical protein [Anaerolineaceae bacterium]